MVYSGRGRQLLLVNRGGISETSSMFASTAEERVKDSTVVRLRDPTVKGHGFVSRLFRRRKCGSTDLSCTRFRRKLQSILYYVKA